eukprot:13582379-Alexandrium_andersonii.AAC.1
MQTGRAPLAPFLLRPIEVLPRAPSPAPSPGAARACSDAAVAASSARFESALARGSVDEAWGALSASLEA